MLMNGTRAVHQLLGVCQIRQIQTTAPSQGTNKAGIRGHWYRGSKKKGVISAPQRDVINGVQLPTDHPKLRFSYTGHHKYEWDRTEPVRPWDRPELAKPNFGQYNRSVGDTLVYHPECGYRLHVSQHSHVFDRDQERRERQILEFGKRMETRMVRKQNPYPCSFVDPLVWRFVEKLKLNRHAGVDRAFDIMVEALQLVKLSQMKLKKENPKKSVELNSNIVLHEAVKNVTPSLRIDFIQVIRKQDGFKPCPVPITKEEGTELAIKRFKIASKEYVKTVSPVKPEKLANHIIDAYYKRGIVYEVMQEDARIGQQCKDMYMRHGRVTHSVTKRMKYNPLFHIKNVMKVTLPLTNEEYSKSPGEPEWNEDDLLEEEDKRATPLKSGIGRFPA